MMHALRIVASTGWLALRALVLYFAAILKHLNWPQAFLVFLLLFPRPIKNLLVTLTRLLEKVKTIHWGEVKGDLEETSKAVERAEQSKEVTQEDSEGGDITPREGPSFTEPSGLRVDLLPLESESQIKEYSKLLESEARMEAELASMGFPMKRTQRSPIERFLNVSQAIETSLSRLYFLYGLQDPATSAGSSVRRMAAGLLGIGVLAEEMYDSFGKYQTLRNRIVHSSVAETEVIEAFLLGRRLYGLIQAIPLPEYRVLEPKIAVSDQPEMDDLAKDIHVIFLVSEKSPKRVPFLTTQEFKEGMKFVPTTKPNERLRGYFYYSLDGQRRRIAGQGLDLTILYSQQ